MSTDRIVITGASGGAANRLEINTFIRNDRFFSLYIQAIQAMYNDTQTNYKSFFQLGGIHGLPYVPWDGAVGNQPIDPDNQWGGYCVHGSVLFPTWHRPYVMLYEQIMQQKAKQIASTYSTDTQAWVQAAEQIRQPYWDWAINSVPPPEVISLANVNITAPSGQRVSVANPLTRYTFHPIDPSFGSPYNGWRTTLRQPTSLAPNATSNVTRMTSVLRNAQSNIRSNTYSMLTRVRNWTAFASHTVGDGGSSSNSLEAIHDGIHVYVGGNGHMGDPGVAAFDPIFYLHHCNVDRMLSLWSAINPGVWVAPGDSENGTFTLPPEYPVDKNTPLTPFWNSNTGFWPSSATTATATLGYSYPEFTGLDMGNPTAVKTAISNIVNKLYGGQFFGASASSIPAEISKVASSAEQAVKSGISAITQHASSSVAGAGATISAFAAPAQQGAQQPLQVQSERKAGSGSTPQKANDPHPTVHPVDTGRFSGLWDWTARIEFKKYELNCSFYVILFLGPVPEDPNEWLVSPNFVGSHVAFVNSAAGHCANCRNNAGLVEEGFVHLDEGIIKHSGLTHLDPNVVEPYLIKNLSWRVQKVDGSVAELESLEVSVLATELSYPPGAVFPVPGQTHHHHRITHGRPGGSRHA